MDILQLQLPTYTKATESGIDPCDFAVSDFSRPSISPIFYQTIWWIKRGNYLPLDVLVWFVSMQNIAEWEDESFVFLIDQVLSAEGKDFRIQRGKEYRFNRISDLIPDWNDRKHKHIVDMVKEWAGEVVPPGMRFRDDKTLLLAGWFFIAGIELSYYRTQEDVFKLKLLRDIKHFLKIHASFRTAGSLDMYGTLLPDMLFHQLAQIVIAHNIAEVDSWGGELIEYLEIWEKGENRKFTARKIDLLSIHKELLKTYMAAPIKTSEKVLSHETFQAIQDLKHTLKIYE